MLYLSSWTRLISKILMSSLEFELLFPTILQVLLFPKEIVAPFFNWKEDKRNLVPVIWQEQPESTYPSPSTHVHNMGLGFHHPNLYRFGGVSASNIIHSMISIFRRWSMIRTLLDRCPHSLRLPNLGFPWSSRGTLAIRITKGGNFEELSMISMVLPLVRYKGFLLRTVPMLVPI